MFLNDFHFLFEVVFLIEVSLFEFIIFGDGGLSEQVVDSKVNKFHGDTGSDGLFEPLPSDLVQPVEL